VLFRSPAFPVVADGGVYATGMTLLDYFAGQALANSAICTGKAEDYQIVNWFGDDAAGITRSKIVAAQADEYATTMLAQREKG